MNRGGPLGPKRPPPPFLHTPGALYMLKHPRLLASLTCASMMAAFGLVLGCAGDPPTHPGATGTAGTSGAAGVTGAAGTTGAAGVSGQAGTSGQAGDSGAAGAG